MSFNRKWNEHSPRIIADCNLKETSKGEWHGACPNCGGKDRFWINEYKGDIKAHCRKCGDFKKISEILFPNSFIDRKQSFDNNTSTENKNTFFKSYDQRKGIELIDAKKDGNDVVIDIYSADGLKVGQQTISPDGTKKFTHGMKKKGASALIGDPNSDTFFYAEGYATAVSVYQSTGKAVVFALDAGNLPEVTKHYRDKYPEKTHIVAADNDPDGIKAAEKSKLPYALPPKNGQDWNDVFQEQGSVETKQLLKTLILPKSKLLTRISDIEFKAPEYLIPGMIESCAQIMVIGASGAGKSFVALGIALCIASGAPYNDRTVEKGLVVSINGEGHRGIPGRVDAWCVKNGIKKTDLDFYISDRAVNMTNAETFRELQSELDEIVRLRGTPKMIVVDTLARATGGADENSSKDMGLFIEGCGELIVKYKCTILLIHHTGHNNTTRARGSSALFAAADAELIVEAIGKDDITVKFQKMKDAPTPEKMQFVKVPCDDSLFLELVPVSSTLGRKPLSPNESIAFEAFNECIKGKTQVSLDEWRPYFMERHTGDNIKSKDTAFRRTRKSLVVKKYLEVKNDIYSFGDTAT
ncbi:AAA family ATPase [Paracoccaceae bacterium]|nr:AAA family ATPase [Paracoccaceae bacterium]